MIKRLSVISLITILLCSCNREEMVPATGCGWVCIGVAVPEIGVKGTVPDDMAVNILDSDGRTMDGFCFPAGSVPEKIALRQGSYFVEAVSSNFSHWREDNSGHGSVAYSQKKGFEIEPDMYSFVHLEAEMVNYGICFRVEDGLDRWFTDFGLEVRESAGRTVNLPLDATGWFDSSSVSIVINVTNTDGDSFSSVSPYVLRGQAGHLYTLTYFLTPASDGSMSLSVTVDDEFGNAGDEILNVLEK